MKHNFQKWKKFQRRLSDLRYVRSKQQVTIESTAQLNRLVKVDPRIARKLTLLFGVCFVRSYS